MGEPLMNFENVKLSVQMMVDNKRFGLSPKQVTVSTVGVVQNIYRLTDELPSVCLAFSLHAPNQDIRIKIVPAAAVHHLDKLMEAIDYHIRRNCTKHGDAIADVAAAAVDGITVAAGEGGDDATSMRAFKGTTVMIEYILIRDINDHACAAHELGALLRPRRHNIFLNLIPYNPTAAGGAHNYESPPQESIDTFFRVVSSPEYGIYTRVRQEMGQDIAGACGQLALVNPSSNPATATATDCCSDGSSCACDLPIATSAPAAAAAWEEMISDIEDVGKLKATAGATAGAGATGIGQAAVRTKRTKKIEEPVIGDDFNLIEGSSVSSIFYSKFVMFFIVTFIIMAMVCGYYYGNLHLYLIN